MQQTKSPFFVIEEFISPLACEDIIYRLNHVSPDYDLENKPLMTSQPNRLSDMRLLPSLEEIVPELEEYYNYEHKGIIPLAYEWYVAGCKDVKPQCSNSAFINHKWARINDYDFTGIIFLNDYQETPPFDPSYEVVGGKLEFPYHKFAFNPKRGTLIIFPGDQHFVHHTSKILAGELTQIRFQIVAETMYNYDKNNFNGTYQDWFAK